MERKGRYEGSLEKCVADEDMVKGFFFSQYGKVPDSEVVNDFFLALRQH